MSDTVAPAPAVAKPRRTLTRAVIRFAGDSGDGMQVTGEQFTTEAAWAGNDISTLPNFPAEIRAPAGTLFGVSSFQLQFGSQRIYTRPLDPTLDAIKKRFAKNPTFVEANIRVLKAGHAFGETAEMFSEHYGVEPAEMAPGLYRSMTGNRAVAWGLLAAAERTRIPIVFGA